MSDLMKIVERASDGEAVLKRVVFDDYSNRLKSHGHIRNKIDKAIHRQAANKMTVYNLETASGRYVVGMSHIVVGSHSVAASVRSRREMLFAKESVRS